MSSKTKTQTSNQTDTETTVAAKEPEFYFPQYHDNTDAKDRSDISEMLKPGVDFAPYHAAWIRYDKKREAAKNRYFQEVRKETHGHIFAEEAFDDNGVIGMGHEFMHPSFGGIPEVTLHIRPAAANEAEQAAMSDASARRLREDGQMQGLRDGIQNEINRANNKVVDTALFGGVSFNRGGWS